VGIFMVHRTFLYLRGIQKTKIHDFYLKIPRESKRGRKVLKRGERDRKPLVSQSSRCSSRLVAKRKEERPLLLTFKFDPTILEGWGGKRKGTIFSKQTKRRKIN
jgi:hypothetical protein